MKKSLFATLVAAPLLTLSSMTFAAEPVLLSATEMDNITAGTTTYNRYVFKYAEVTQVNVSPVTVVQISAANLNLAGGGGAGNNTAVITSGNFSTIRQ